MKGKKIAFNVLMTCLLISNSGYAEDVTYNRYQNVTSTVSADNIIVIGGPINFDQYKNGKVDVIATNDFTISNTPVYVKTGDISVGNILTVNKGANLYVSTGSINAGTLEISGYFSMDPSDVSNQGQRKIEAEIINTKKDSYFTAKNVEEIKANVINHGGSTFATQKITAKTIIMGVDGEGSYPTINANEIYVDTLNLNKGAFFYWNKRRDGCCSKCKKWI